MSHAYQGGPPLDRLAVNKALGLERPACPTPTKMTYDSVDAAWRAVRARHRTGHAYRCRCGMWHTTSMAKAEAPDGRA